MNRLAYFVDDSTTFHHSLSTNKDKVNLLHDVSENKASCLHQHDNKWAILTTTRILFVFQFLFKFFNSSEVYNL